MEKKLRLSLIFKAAGNATSFLRGMKGESQKAAEAVSNARDKLQTLKAAAGKVQSLRTLQGQLGQTRFALAAAQQKAQALAREHAAAEAPTKKMTTALERARVSVNQLKVAEERQATAVGRVKRELEAAGVSTKRLAGTQGVLEHQIERANEELKTQETRLEAVARRQGRMNAARGRYDRTQQLAGSMQGAGASAIGAGAALGAPLVLAAREAMGFQEAMADVRKVVDFPTPQAFRQMSNDILSLGDRLPVATGELAAILAQGARAGVARNDLLAFTEAAAKMGVAFDVTSEEAAGMMATWRTALGLTQPEVIALADRVNALTNSYGGNAAAVSEMITRVGPLGDVAGAGGPALAALAQIMNSVGVEAEVGATGIKNMLLGLTRGEAASKRQQAAFQALGLDASDMARRMQTDATGAILSVLDAVSGLSEDRQLSVLSQLFGTESVAAISPLLSQLDLVRRNFNSVGDAQFYAGSMQREFAARAATSANDLDLAKNSLKGMAIEIGTNFLPAISAGAKWLAGAASAVRGFASEHPNATKVVAGLVAVVAAGLIVFGGVALAIAAVLGPFALLQLTLTQSAILFGPLMVGLRGVTASFLAFNAALWANPITWVVAGVIALAASAYLIYRNWGRIKPWLAGIWGGITGIVGRAFGFLKTLFLTFHPLGIIINNWRPIVGFLRSLGTLMAETVGLGLDLVKYALLRFTPLGFIMRNWQPVVGLVRGVLDRTTGVAQAALGGLIGLLMRYSPVGFIVRNWSQISTALSGVWNAITWVVRNGAQVALSAVMAFTPLGLIVRNWSGVSGVVGGVWTRVRSIISSALSVIRALLAGFNPLGPLQQAFAGVFGWLANLPGRFLQFGTQIVTGFINGIRGRRAAVQAATQEVGRAAEGGTRSSLQIRSPSRVFARLGGHTMDGFTLGLRRGASGPVRQMRAAAAAIAAAGAVAAPGISAARAQGLDPGTIAPAWSSSQASRSAPPTTPSLQTPNPSARSGSSARANVASGPISITINVQAAPGQSEDRIAQLIEQRLRDLFRDDRLGQFGDDQPSWGGD